MQRFARPTSEAAKLLAQRTAHRMRWLQEHVPNHAKPTEEASQIRCYFQNCDIDVWPSTGTWCVVGENHYWKRDWAGFQIKVFEELAYAEV